MSNTTTPTAEKKWPRWEQFSELWRAGLAFFNNDGCTSVPDFNFKECCVEHDYLYFTKEVSRAEADKRLRECIGRQKWRMLPWIYWVGVRLLGRKYYGRTGRPIPVTMPEGE